MNAIRKFGMFVFAFIILGVGYIHYPALGVEPPKPTRTEEATPLQSPEATVTQNAAATESTPHSTAPEGSQAEAQTVTGWFNTIWNGEPRYLITNEHGQEYRLLLDETTAKSLGGALQFDRRRVTITGKMVHNSASVLQVLSIRLVPGN